MLGNNIHTLFLACRKSTYRFLGRLDSLLSTANGIVIYCYHGISTNSRLFDVHPADFQKQMQHLASWGKSVSLGEIIDHIKTGKKLPNKSFAITFDDGYRNILTMVDFLENLHIKPTVFVLTGQGKNASNLFEENHLLSDKELSFLAKKGWIIGSHGITHEKLTNLTPQKANEQFSESKRTLENTLRIPVEYFAYPHGNYSSRLFPLLHDCGYRAAFSMDDRVIQRNTVLSAIPRVGVMGNHSHIEFTYIASPSVLFFRKLIKTIFPFLSFI